MYVIGSSGGTATRIDRTRLLYHKPAWAPDGSQIAVAMFDEFDPSEIQLIAPDGSSQIKLMVDGDVWDPSWSPDGTKLAYTRFDPEGQIWAVDLGTSKPQLLIDEGTQPAWSPDGEMIAFVCEGNEKDICTFRLRDGLVTRVTNSPAWETHPAWSPDSTQIAYTSQQGDQAEGIYVVRRDGSGVALYEEGAWDPNWGSS